MINDCSATIIALRLPVPTDANSQQPSQLAIQCYMTDVMPIGTCPQNGCSTREGCLPEGDKGAEYCRARPSIGGRTCLYSGVFSER
jgi:hypothetical protein